MDNHKLVTISIFGFFLNMKGCNFCFFFFLKNMLGKILGFGRVYQNIFFLFEKSLKFFIFYFLKYFEENRVF